jgi:hypothetical protein
MDNPQDKREVERISCYLEGELISDHGDYNQVILYDISAAGAEVRTHRPVRVNAQVRINVITKKLTPFVLEGKIRWCKKDDDVWQAGIAFHRPLPLPFNEIAQFMH